MPRSNYVLQLDSKTTCYNCHSNVSLLCDQECSPGKPMFYICWNCKVVAESGKGVVRTAND